MARSIGRRAATTAVIVVLPPALALIITNALGFGFPEWIFFTVCLFAMGTAGYLLHHAALRALHQRHRADALAQMDPERVVRDALTAERHRLSAEIASELQRLLVRVRELAHTGEPGSAEQIHRLAGLAATDLRRQLGLLRDPVNPEPSLPTASSRRGPQRADLCVGIGVATLAGVESWWYPRAEGLAAVPGAVPMTVLAALPLIALRAHPALVASSVGMVQLAGLSMGVPVTHGFWIVAAVGAPLWRLAARPWALRSGSAAGLLITGTVLTGVLTPADDLAVLLAVLGVAVGAGVLTGHWRQREALARSAADRRAGDLTEATAAAIEAERLAYAREIHDTVSHAVGVIAMQASVAQVAAAHEQRSALAMIGEVADAALRELDRDGDRSSPSPAADGIQAVVHRMRAAGLSVSLDGVDRIPAGCAGLAYRIIQEGLTNIARHAPGAGARIAVDSCPEGVTIVITDNGPGPGSGHAPGYGLIGLRERISYLGGSLHLEPSPAGGFRLRAWLPQTDIEAL